MKHAFGIREEFKKQASGKNIFLFLDYDGTLTPIMKHPKLSRLDPAVKRVLKKLSARAGIKLAIVSGRELADVKKRVGIKGIIYAGNHGLEIKGPGIKFTAPVPSGIKAVLGRICRDLETRLSDIRGILIENKGLSLSIHYRRVAQADFWKVRKALKETIAQDLKSRRIKVNTGKKVFEIKPPVVWNKGHAVSWLLKKFTVNQKKTLPIFIGDDVTDEDAFQAIRSQGLGIFVGKPKKSCARYYLRDDKEVQKFLEGV